MKTISGKQWHQLEAAEALEALEVDAKKGLTNEEVEQRRRQFGWNRFQPRRGKSPFVRFLLQFNQPLVYILLAATAVTLLLHEWVDSSVIFGVVLVNAIIGFIQESKAEKAIEALNRMVVTEATVLRDGQRVRVPSAELVPGDIVLLHSGDKVPADLRLTRVKNLQVDESALTGESVPVTKDLEPVEAETMLAERRNLAFGGTLVTYGQAEGVVSATGDRTETGRIAELIAESPELSTPLTRKIAYFSRLLVIAILSLAAASFVLGLWRGEPWVEMFMASVALAVGAIPEGLPAAVTITLAIGVSRMAKRRSIIRHLPSVETLGSATVICSDKTGTLTENKMSVREVFAGGKKFEISGIGYDGRGEFFSEGKRVGERDSSALAECLKAGILCNDSELVYRDGAWDVQGDPTEVALIVAAKKLGLIHSDVSDAAPRIDAIPFESEYQFMATLHDHEREETRVIYKKGAVERLLNRCSRIMDEQGELREMDDSDREQIQQQADRMSSEGLRVLAFASRFMPKEQSEIDHSHVEEELTFLGLQGMMDPPREDAVQAVAQCQRAGIQVKMITGDNMLTAKAVAKQLGLKSKSGVENGHEIPALVGRDVEGYSDEELIEVVERTAVFARVAPEQKLRLVRALQANGEVVAMTGDGVNDAPALKQADIGIAMAITGTDVAKGASDMLLTDDNFASIEAAVEEGRNVFDNLKKFITWTLPTNGGEGLIILAAILFGTALPVEPVQLLWINMTTAIFLGLMLVFEPKEPDLMDRPPRDPKEPLLTLPLFMRIGLVSLITMCGAFGLFLWERNVTGSDLAKTQTIVVNVIVAVEALYLLNCRSLLRSMFSLGVFSNPWVFAGLGSMLVLQLMLTYIPVMNRLFNTAPISGSDWAKILSVGVFAYAVVGLEKWIRSRLDQYRGVGEAR